MIKKLKELAADEDNQLARAVRASAHQIWQAGLGAFVKAQKEGGRVFSELVQEGAELQKRTRSLAEDRVSEMTETVGKVADGVSKQASGSWDKLEQVFEDRVARALGTIGVPTRKDIEALGRQVEQLRAMVADMAGPKAAHKPAAKARAMSAAKKPALKAAAKKAAPRKPAAKKAGAAKAGQP
jgi:poly(hydroxyalkanoate) granule-associated protein